MALGIFWIAVEPLANLLMMTAVFGMLLRVDTGNYPYVAFAFAGLMPWLLFNKAMTAAANSLTDNTLRNWAEELLAEKGRVRQGLFRPGRIRKRWETHVAGTNLAYPLWNVLVAQVRLEANPEVSF
jgi:hypothetical protein